MAITPTKDDNIEIHVGAKFNRDYQWTVSGVGQDISASTIVATFYDTDETVLATLTDGSGLTKTNSSNGQFEIDLTEVQTTAIGALPNKDKHFLICLTIDVDGERLVYSHRVKVRKAC